MAGVKAQKPGDSPSPSELETGDDSEEPEDLVEDVEELQLADES
jgi:hypothetical protein